MHSDSGLSVKTRLADTSTRIFLLIAALYAVYTLMTATHWAGVSNVVLVTDLWAVFFSLAATYFTWRASTCRKLTERQRRGWRFLACGFLSYFIGDIIRCYSENVLKIQPYPSLADAGYLAYYPFILTGLFYFTIGIPDRIKRAQFWVDAAVVVIGCSAIIWYFLLLPIAGAEYNSTLELVLSEIYPASDILLLFGATLLIMQRKSLQANPAISLVLAAIMVQFMADLWFSYQNLEEAYVAGGALDLLFITAPMLMITSAYIEYGREQGRRGSKAPAAHMHTISALPYAAILFTFVLMLYVVRDRLHEPFGGLVAAAIILTLLIMVRQVLSLRLIRETEARFVSMVQHSTDAIAILETDFRIRFVSQSAERVFGRHLESLLWARFIDLVHPHDQARVQDIIATSLSKAGASLPFEWRIIYGSGELRHIESVISNRCRDPAIGGLILNSRNVTERKEIEASTKAREEAERASNAKSEFLSRMSHELRTPMNAIMASGQILNVKLTDNALKENVHEIMHAGRHLLVLIDELLDISRLDTGQLELAPESFDVGGIFSECQPQVQKMADEKDILIQARKTGQCAIFADRRRVREVLMHLLANAIKYNRDKGSVTMEYGMQPNGNVRVTVSDTGKGIPADQQERVFQPFTKIHRKDGTVEGTGIGLTISRQLVEAMGGEMGFRSNPGAGSAFWFELPSGPKHGTSPGGLSATMSSRH